MYGLDARNTGLRIRQRAELRVTLEQWAYISRIGKTLLEPHGPGRLTPQGELSETASATSHTLC
jgi:hypothetical protein